MDDKRKSKTLIPPEALLSEDQPVTPKTSTKIPEISTPNKPDTTNISTNNMNTSAAEASTPSSNELDAIDLNIVNLESVNDLRIDGRARSSPSVREFNNDQKDHRKTASTSNLPKNAEDPEDRLEHGRQYSLDLGPTQDHVIIEIEQERARKSNERKFKIVVGLLIFGILFTVTFFMVAWEMGYLNAEESFSTPVFY